MGGEVQSGTIQERKARIRALELAAKAYPGLKQVLTSQVLDANLRRDIVAGLVACTEMGIAQGIRIERGRGIEGVDVFRDLIEEFSDYDYRPGLQDVSVLNRLNSEDKLRSRQKRYDSVVNSGRTE